MSDDKFIDPKILPKPQSGLIAGFRNSFLTGLVVIAPRVDNLVNLERDRLDRWVCTTFYPEPLSS